MNYLINIQPCLEFREKLSTPNKYCPLLNKDDMLQHINNHSAKDVLDISRNARCKVYLVNNLEQIVNKLVFERDRLITTQ